MRRASRQGRAALALVVATIALVAVVSEHAFAASAGDPAAEAAPKCRKAEVNPVTGHVLCLDPLGAPVDPPPAAELPPCKPDERSGEVWTWGPKCKG
jgi:hypothetical protein